MDPTKRTSWKIWTIGAATLAMLIFASSATASDRGHGHRGARINDQLDSLAVFAALSGDPHLAVALDRTGDRIEHSIDGRKLRDRRGDHVSDRWRRQARNHHRHFDGRGHSRINDHSKRGRHSWRRSHRDRREVRRHTRNRRH